MACVRRRERLRNGEEDGYSDEDDEPRTLKREAEGHGIDVQGGVRSRGNNDELWERRSLEEATSMVTTGGRRSLEETTSMVATGVRRSSKEATSMVATGGCRRSDCSMARVQ